MTKYFDGELKESMQRTQALIDRDTQQKFNQQVQAGRCDLSPLPGSPMQPFRSEFLVERHPLFVVNAYKKNSFVSQRLVTDPESKEKVTQTIRVGLHGNKGKAYGVLKQVHQAAFYKILRLWGEQGYPVSDDHKGVVKSTAYDMVKLIRGHISGDHYLRTKEILGELNGIPVSVENAYGAQGLEDTETFTLLNGVHWKTRKFNNRTLRSQSDGMSEVTISISTIITEGFMRKQVKQLMWQPYEDLGRCSEIARLLYFILDYELSSKNSYHISLALLAARIGLRAQAYPSDRARPFKKAAKQLNGLPILGNRYRILIAFRASADGQDVVLFASRKPSHLPF